MTEPIVLIVDDEDGIREVLSELLKASGWCVLEAKNGKEAMLKIINEKNIKIVLSDIHMPKMTGLELLKEINSFFLSEKPLVFLMTGGGLKHEEEARALGAIAFLDKSEGLESIYKLVANKLKIA